MNPMVRNILAVIAGVVVCAIVYVVIIEIGIRIIPPPDSMEFPLGEAHLFPAKHFITPFLAHALGSLFGGLVAALIAATRKMTFALVIGVLNLLVGAAASFMNPVPVWFIVLDLVVAYIPPAWLGGKLAGEGGGGSLNIT